MSLVFDVFYVAFFAGVVGLSALALLGIAVPWRAFGPLAVRVVAGIGVLALLARGVASGHLPLFGTFENTLAASGALLAAASVTSLKREGMAAWAWPLPWALPLLLYGTIFRHEAIPLTISEQSLWVDVHVVFAWLAFVGLALASTLAVGRLFGRTMWGMGPEEADEQTARYLNLGFAALTATIALGAWYLYLLFSTFWRWEVVGTMSLVAWMGYGMVIHARHFYRLGGKRLAVAVVAVLPVMFLAFWIWSLTPGTYHYFDIPLLKPY